MRKRVRLSQRRSGVRVLLVCGLMAAGFPSAWATPDGSGKAADTRRAAVALNYRNLPLSFEINRGQADKRVKFLSRGSGYSLFLTAEEAVVALRKPSAGRSVPGSRGLSPHGVSPDG